MATSVYSINKGINQPIEFKGLQAQYIWWLGGGLLLLLLLFAVLYLCGVHPYLCLALILLAGTGLFYQVYRFSRTYGIHGLMKALARRRIPTVVTLSSRTPLLRLCKQA